MVTCIMVALITILIAFSLYPIVFFLISCLIATLVGIGIWEYGKMVKTKELNHSIRLMMIVGIAIVFSFYLSHEYEFFVQLPSVILALGVLLFFINHFKQTQNALLNIAVETFALIYIAIPLSLMLEILYPLEEDLSIQEGRWWLVYLILITKITDVGAYFIGKLFGHKRLAPIISPKKTIAGAIGGFLCAILFSELMFFVGKNWFFLTIGLNGFERVLLASLIGVLSQMGDLAESLLKRDAHVKDSNALPGVGGILDMIDSLIFTTPVVYFFLKWYAPL